MSRLSLRIALIALGAAAVAWVGVFFFARAIHGGQAAMEQAILESRQANTSEESRNAMLAVLNSTELGRQHIRNMLTIDVLSLAHMVVSVGTDAGVAVRVSNATQETPAVQKNKDATTAISAVNFTIEAEGSFEKLYTALALLEKLPAPARVEEVHLTHMENDQENPWRMKIRLRILTMLPPGV